MTTVSTLHPNLARPSRLRQPLPPIAIFPTHRDPSPTIVREDSASADILISHLCFDSADTFIRRLSWRSGPGSQCTRLMTAINSPHCEPHHSPTHHWHLCAVPHDSPGRFGPRQARGSSADANPSKRSGPAARVTSKEAQRPCAGDNDQAPAPRKIPLRVHYHHW